MGIIQENIVTIILVSVTSALMGFLWGRQSHGPGTPNSLKLSDGEMSNRREPFDVLLWVSKAVLYLHSPVCAEVHGAMLQVFQKQSFLPAISGHKECISGTWCFLGYSNNSHTIRNLPGNQDSSCSKTKQQNPHQPANIFVPVAGILFLGIWSSHWPVCPPLLASLTGQHFPVSCESQWLSLG